jgi:hypothetical protein
MNPAKSTIAEKKKKAQKTAALTVGNFRISYSPEKSPALGLRTQVCKQSSLRSGHNFRPREFV